MNLKELLLPEFEHEIALTEKVINRVPADKLDWQPHEKSMSMKQLVNHLAEMPSWVNGTLDVDEIDVSNYQPVENDTLEGAMATLKENTKKAVASLKASNNADYSKDWAMKKGKDVLIKMSKYNVLRTMVFNQLPHHRAQLGVYLRLLDVPVPATYGPSADENPM